MAAFDFKIRALKANFFDPKKLAARAAKTSAAAQSKFGAYTRRTMKNSIKYRAKGTAPPGAPPFAHRAARFTREKVNRKTGAVTRSFQSPLRELIFFARDPATRSVVVGPVAFGAGGAGALERGGPTTVTDRATGRKKTIFIRPHPYARPAGDAEAKKFPELLRASIN